tara:strand:+ start:89 stop:340 length:252 start_codon:yes stop_codon:yes gene_type:complete
MSIPKIQRWSVTGVVMTETPDNISITRQVATFEIDATTPREVVSKWKDIVTSAWRGPCKVEFDLGMFDEARNYWQANQDGLKD